MPYRKLKDTALKNGQPAELGVAIAPAPDWHERLCAYLNAPPQPEGPPLHAVLLTHTFPGLEARYFTMLRSGEIVGCIVTTDGASAGYINSTFVPRPFRQLGIATQLMEALEADFSGRGGAVRFLTTRTGSPAQGLFENFGYRAVWDRNGRTGMEKHYRNSCWEAYFSADPQGLQVEEVAWKHWNPHRALLWTRRDGGYHPLDGDFLSRIRERLAGAGTRWKGLASADGRLFGSAVLRPHNRWNDGDVPYVLDLYVHPQFRDAADTLLEAVLPPKGHVQTFLDGASREAIAFFQQRGFELEASLRYDFNHHDPATPDIRVYSRHLG